MFVFLEILTFCLFLSNTFAIEFTEYINIKNDNKIKSNALIFFRTLQTLFLQSDKYVLLVRIFCLCQIIILYVPILCIRILSYCVSMEVYI